MRKFELRQGEKEASTYQKRQRKKKQEDENLEELRQKEEVEMQPGAKGKGTPPPSPLVTTGLGKKFDKTEKDKDKDMQGTLEAMEKNLEQRIEQSEQKMLAGMKTMMTELMENMRKEIKMEVEGLRSEIQQHNIKVDDKIQQIEDSLKGTTAEASVAYRLARRTDRKTVRLECLGMETHIRLRGVPELTEEEQSESLVVEIEDLSLEQQGATGGEPRAKTRQRPTLDRQKIIKSLAEYLEISVEEMDNLCDKIYRVNSQFAKIKKVPRDIIVQLTKRTCKEEIMRKQFRDKLKIEGKEVRIMKELPRQVLQDRKNYRRLTEKLRLANVRFRWEIPEGLTFNWEGRRVVIESVAEMEEFLRQPNGEKIFSFSLIDK